MRRPSRNPRPDVPGVVAGTVLAGAGTIWMLTENGVVQTDDLGVASALLLVTAGLLGLAASRRG